MFRAEAGAARPSMSAIAAVSARVRRDMAVLLFPSGRRSGNSGRPAVVSAVESGTTTCIVRFARSSNGEPGVASVHDAAPDPDAVHAPVHDAVRQPGDASLRPLVAGARDHPLPRPPVR